MCFSVKSHLVRILQFKYFWLMASIVCILFSCQTYAANTKLTPLGAIQAGNADNSIPEWREPENVDLYYDGLSKTLKNEKPLYIISASNYLNYKHLFSDGQIALFEAYPQTFTMPVYRSYRSFFPPKWFIQLSIENAGSARLNPHGELIGHKVGVPFPTPKTGEEVMWNHLLSWIGVAGQLEVIETIVNADGRYNFIKNKILMYRPSADPYRPDAIPDWVSMYYLSKTIYPKRLSGGAFIYHQSYLPITRPSQAWLYVAAQRRSRRIPDSGYDVPMPNSGGIRVVDEMNMFFGALDRYNWEIVEKKEMLIPYNNIVMNESITEDRLGQLLTPFHVNPEFARYERHRVWKVKATLKPGMRHIYAERIFYIDEDTWVVLMDDKFDAKGDLTRSSFRYSGHDKPLRGNSGMLDVFYDLKNKRYFIQAVPKVTLFYGEKAIDKKLFSPKNMRKFVSDSTDTRYVDGGYINLDAYQQ